MRIIYPFKEQDPNLLSTKLRTQIIQEAINYCSENDGGKIVIDCPGIYEIDGIILKSKIELVIEDGVHLVGSGDVNTYKYRPGSFELLRNETPICSLFYGKDCQNCYISGSGTVSGNYKTFIKPSQENSQHIAFYDYPRPMTFYFENSQDIHFENLHIVDAPFWTIHLVGCQNVKMSHLTIENEVRMPNTDGIDIDRCQNVWISNCTIITGDDAICLKCTEETYNYGNCTNIHIEHCMLHSQSSAFKVGSSSFGDFENVSCKNVKICDSNRGIAFQLRDSGSARNFYFSNIEISTREFSEEWWGSAEAIYITFLARDNLTQLVETDTIENIVFEDIKSNGPRGIFIYEDRPERIKQITFRDTKVFIKNVQTESVNYDLRPAEHLEKVVGSLKAATEDNKFIKFENVEENFII